MRKTRKNFSKKVVLEKQELKDNSTQKEEEQGENIVTSWKVTHGKSEDEDLIEELLESIPVDEIEHLQTDLESYIHRANEEDDAKKWLKDYLVLWFNSPLKDLFYHAPSEKSIEIHPVFLKQAEELEKMANELDDLKTELVVLQEEKAKRLELDRPTVKMYSRSVQELFGEEEKGLTALLERNEPEEEDVKDYISFIHSFAKEWKGVRLLLDIGYEDELTFVKQLDSVLRILLQKLSGSLVACRKPVLVWVAKQCTNVTENFEFISPEFYAKIEPEYHTIIGQKGTRVLEGVSFLIIRKNNKQVFFKAEVKAV